MDESQEVAEGTKRAKTSGSVKWLLLWLAVALIVLVPSIDNGLQQDDLFQWALVSGDAPRELDHVLDADLDGSVASLFGFLDGDPVRTQRLVDEGLLPWWVDLENKWVFWRPLAELTHILDYQYLKLPWLMHIHSLIWYVAMLLVAFQVLKLFQPDRRAALWSFAFFALYYGNGIPVGWLANRNAILAMLAGWLSVWAFYQYTQQPRFVLLGGALLAWACALLSGEIGVATGAYLFSITLFFDRSGQRWRNLAPFVVVGIAWLMMRRWLGYSAGQSDRYIDPFSDPAKYFEVLLERLPDLLIGVMWPLPPEFGFSASGALLVTLVGMSALLFFWWLPLLGSCKTARYWLVTMILSCLPVTAAEPESRLLAPAGFAYCGLLGLALTRAWSSLELARHGRALIARILKPALILTMGVGSALMLFLTSISLKLYGDLAINRPAVNWPSGVDAPVQVLINPHSSSVAGYIQAARSYRGDTMSVPVWPLATGTSTLTLTRVDADSILLSSESGLYRDIDHALRPESNPPAAGDQLAVGGGSEQMLVTVIDVEDNAVKQVQFDFSASLDDSTQVALLIWAGGHPTLCQAPRIGEVIELTTDTESCAPPPPT